MSETAPELVLFDPTIDGFFDDPYAHYRDMREANPVYLHPWGIWILTRWNDIDFVLRDFKLFSNASVNFGGQQQSQGDVTSAGNDDEGDFNVARGTLPFMDPPQHTRVRKLVSGAFTPRVVANMRPTIAALVDSILDDVEASGGTFEVTRRLATQVPLRVICQLLGIPEEDEERIAATSADFVVGIDPGAPQEQVERSMTGAMQLAIYFIELIQKKQAEPGEDLTSRLNAVKDGNDSLTMIEVLGTLIAMVTAGHETTSSLIGTGLLSLIRHPEQCERLRQDPSLIKNAVEEMLRFEAPLQLAPAPRIALDDVEIGGCRIRKGDAVRPVLGAANRDPAVFADPDRFDVGRENANQHLSFATGVHFCMGSALARLEAEVVFERLLGRYRSLSLAETPVWKPLVAIRSLDRLMLSVER